MMQAAGDVARDLFGEIDPALTCRRCKARVEFRPGQTELSCPACGFKITASPRLRRAWGHLTASESKSRCQHCHDVGLVFVERQVDNELTQPYGYRCVCPAGAARDPGHKGGLAWPVIAPADLPRNRRR